MRNGRASLGHFGIVSNFCQEISWDPSDMIFFSVVGIVFAQIPGCDYERCIDTRFGPFKTQISCGVVVSEDPVNGIILLKDIQNLFVESHFL